MKTSIEKLDSMMGKSFMHKTVVYKFERHQIIEGAYVIMTNKGLLHCKVDEVSKFLDSCLPSEDEQTLPEVKKKKSQVQQSAFKGVAEVLLKSIQRIEENPEFIDQAKAINDTVKTMVQVSRNELAWKKAMNNGEIE